MFVEAVYYWTGEDGKIVKIHVDVEQQRYILRNIKDFNALYEYLASIANPWFPGDPSKDTLYFAPISFKEGM